MYVDGGCSKITCGDAWGSVVDEKGIDLLENNLDYLQDLNIEKKQLKNDIRYVIICNFKDVKSQQNNGAELLAMIAGLRISLYSNYSNYPGYSDNKIIKADSDLIVKWWSKGIVSAAKRKTIDPLKLQYIEECKSLRDEYEKSGGVVVKIAGDDNLADLGYHK